MTFAARASESHRCFPSRNYIRDYTHEKLHTYEWETSKAKEATGDAPLKVNVSTVYPFALFPCITVIRVSAMLRLVRGGMSTRWKRPWWIHLVVPASGTRVCLLYTNATRISVLPIRNDLRILYRGVCIAVKQEEIKWKTRRRGETCGIYDWPDRSRQPGKACADEADADYPVNDRLGVTFSLRTSHKIRQWIAESSREPIRLIAGERIP